MPMSKTSGALLVPALVLAALISSADEALGLSSLTLMPGYFFLKPSIT